RTGVVGRTNNVPGTLTAASDVAMLSLFGYDPLAVYTGRAPLECAAMGLTLGPTDWAIRCNLVAGENDQMRDFTAGAITSEEAAALMDTIQQKLGGTVPGGLLEFHAGVSYRNLLIYRAHSEAPFSDQVKTQPPHDIPDQPIEGYLPQDPAGTGAAVLRDLM